MNKLTPAEQFSHELDRLLTTGELPENDLPDEVREALATAQQIAAIDTTVEAEALRQSLRSRFAQRQAINRLTHNGVASQMLKTVTNNQKLAYAAIAVTLVLSALLFAPVRSFAAELLRQIGGITLSTQPTLVEELEAGGQQVSSPVDGAIPTAMPPSMLTVADAEALTGFSVAEVVAPDGFEWVGREVYPGAGGMVDVLTRFARNAEYLSLSQVYFPAGLPSQYGQWNIGDAEVTDVTVSGQPAVFVAQAQIIAVPDGETAGGFTSAGANLLIWEADGMTYTLLSQSLGMDDLIAVAETLTR